MWGVARAFALMTPFLRMYSDYCGLYTRALERISDLRRSAPALTELEAARQELIDSLLIRPVQRLCKYPLFFAEMLKHLPREGGLRREIEAAAAAVQKVNEEVNAKTKNMSDISRLAELHVELGGKLTALLAPTRTLIMEADVKLSSGRTAARRRKYKVVVLSDAVILARVRKPPALGRVKRALSASLTHRSSSRAETPSSTKAPLKLKAILPLRSLSVQAPPARSGKRLSSKHDALLLLQCQDPMLSYSCKCADPAAAVSLVQAVQMAQAELETATRKSERRASLVDPSNAATAAASAAADGPDSLLAAARRERRQSLRERLTGRRASAADTDNLRATRGAGTSRSHGHVEDGASALDPFAEGIVLSSDSEQDSEDESGSDCSTASEYEDD